MYFNNLSFFLIFFHFTYLMLENMEKVVFIKNSQDTFNVDIDPELLNVTYFFADCENSDNLCEQIEKQTYSTAVLIFSITDPCLEKGIQCLREKFDVPIIAITREEQSDKNANLFNLGADYVINGIKDNRELLAKLDCLKKRSQKMLFKTHIYQIGSLQINLHNHTFQYKGKKISFTPSEAKILEMICFNQQRPISKQDLQILSSKSKKLESSNIINSHLCNIRKKLPPEIKLQTINNLGFKIS